MQNNQNSKPTDTNQANSPQENKNNKTIIFILIGVGVLAVVIAIVVSMLVVFNSDDESPAEDGLTETSEGAETDTNSGATVDEGTTNSEPAAEDGLTETSEGAETDTGSGTTNEGTADGTTNSEPAAEEDVSSPIALLFGNFQAATTEDEKDEAIRKTAAEINLGKQLFLAGFTDYGIEESDVPNMVQFYDLLSNEDNLRKVSSLTLEEFNAHTTQFAAISETLDAKLESCLASLFASGVSNDATQLDLTPVADCVISALDDYGSQAVLLLQPLLD